MRPEDSICLKRTRLPEDIETVGLEFIGAGSQGEVYRIDRNRCIKVYKSKKYFHRELANLKKGEGEPLIPEVFESGKYFIIREYVNGLSLAAYFKKGGPMTAQLAIKLVDLLAALKRVGYRRLDMRLPHIYLTPAGTLKIIDPTNVMNNKRTFPQKLLSGLESYGVKETFLQHVRKIRPDLYLEWQRHLDD